MVVVKQEIKIRWNPFNKSLYENILDSNGELKYKWSGFGSEFIIEFEDIAKSSKIKIDVQCDFCGNIIKKSVGSIHIGRANSMTGKDCCKECKGLKIRENLGTLNDEPVSDDKKENIIYTKEYLISEFYRYRKEFGVYPTLRDLKNNKEFPGAFGYNKFWGNYSSFIKSLDLIDVDGWYKEDSITFKELYLKGSSVSSINSKLIVSRNINEMIKKVSLMKLPYRELFKIRNYSDDVSDIEKLSDSLLDLYGDIGKIPTVQDFEYYLKINNLPSRRLFEKISGKRYSEICNDILGDNNRISKSDDELLQDLIELKNKLGRAPLIIELVPNGISEAKPYTRRFNMTYNELIKSLGWELSSYELINKSKEELLSDFLNLYRKLDRIPDYNDIDLCEGMVSSRTYIKYFNSIHNILKILDIEVLENQSSSKGFVGMNKNNEICKSHKEITISNILIDNNIKYQPEVKYSELDVKLKNKWRMDWYLGDFNIYVEYFGMYSENQLNRNTIVGKYSRNVKRKIEYCNKNNIKLISIFESDLANDFENLIKKFNSYKLNISIV